MSPLAVHDSAPSATTHYSRAACWRRDHLFFTALPLLMLAAVFVGFSQTYYLKTVFGTPALPWLFHIHGLAFTSWMLLLVIQPALVLARRTPAHRQAGWIAAGLVPLMAVLALLVSIDLGRRGAAPPGVPPLVFLIAPMAAVVVFVLAIAAYDLATRRRIRPATAIGGGLLVARRSDVS